MEMLGRFWWWIVTPAHLFYRVPLVILGALIAWAVWMWLWEVFWPWAHLILKALGKLFGKLADALEFIPRKSKQAALYLEHVMDLCDGTVYGCEFHRSAHAAPEVKR